jgi:hypothetical protein
MTTTNDRLNDLAGLLREAGFHHRGQMDVYLVNTISRVVAGLILDDRERTAQRLAEMDVYTR